MLESLGTITEQKRKTRREKDEEKEREDERTAGCDYEMENGKEREERI